MAEPGSAHRRSLQTLPPAVLRPRLWRGFPLALPPLVGRQQEVATLVALLRQPHERLVTVVGPGGVGKTRLAIAAAMAAAPEFAHGAVFVPLATVFESSRIFSAIARTLEIPESPGRQIEETLVATLSGRRLLLVLDNLEHLLPAVELAHLAGSCPELTLLVTSRVPMRLGLERRFRTRPLALPPPGTTALADLAECEAVALFVERAGAARHDFTLDERNAASVAEICRRLDGLPLAIELAAAWVRVLPPPALLDRLTPCLSLLRGGATDRPRRLRTMRDAIAWSYQLLSPSEARLFRRLSLFVGGFTLEAATAVAGEDMEVLAGIATLVDTSLLHLEDEDAPEPRYAMLETVREFARERLAESEEEAAVGAAHASFMLALAERAEPALIGPDETRWHERVASELDNLRAALSWGLANDVGTALRIGGALWIFWAWRQIPEGRRWLEAALSLPEPAPSRTRAKALASAGSLAVLSGEAEGFALALEAASLLRAAGDQMGEARARWFAGAGLAQAGNLPAGMQELDTALALFAAAELPADLALAAYARAVRGTLALLIGERESGFRDYDEALTQLRAAGSPGVTLLVLSDFAGWLIEDGETARARSMLDEAFTMAVRQRGDWLVSTTLISLALIDALEGDAALATSRLGAVDGLRRQGAIFVPTQYQARIDRATALAKAVLGESRYATHWEAGASDAWRVVATAMGEEGALDGESVASALGLTRREREVLRLMVEGESDREIAAALYISSRTASHHVSAILAKLGARTRAAAAAHAVREGLV